jgi:uncharacterized membrane protein
LNIFDLVPHPFAYLKSLASKETADQTSAFVVILTALVFCGGVAWVYTRPVIDKGALTILVGFLAAMVSYAFKQEKEADGGKP